MPPVIGAGAAIVGANLLSQGLNIGAQAKMNRKTREWNEKMYWLQRQHSLQDWTMQNEYNSPQAQMQRFTEAGLNKNLIYGQTNEAPSVRSTDTKAWNPRAPELDLGGAVSTGLLSYYDTQVKQAQVDNLKVQNTVLQQDAYLKAAQVIGQLAGTRKTEADTAMSQFDLGLKNELKEYSVEAARLANDRTKSDITMTLDENERRAAMLQPTLLKSAEEILNMRLQRAKTSEEIDEIKQRIENLKKDARLKELDIEWRASGLVPSDPLWQRLIQRAIGENPLEIVPIPRTGQRVGKALGGLDSLRKR